MSGQMAHRLEPDRAGRSRSVATGKLDQLQALDADRLGREMHGHQLIARRQVVNRPRPSGPVVTASGWASISGISSLSFSPAM
jgi:hypothetical protein